MAFRKATVHQQFSEAIARVLEPGERIEAGVLSQSGPTPWLMGAIGVLVMLLMGMRYYFIAVTDRRVLFFSASLLTVKPRALAWADPRGAGTISDIDADAALWSHFKYACPGESRVTRFNVHRMWRDELRDLLTSMATPSTTSIPAPPSMA
ncbi:MAG: hypothetical protein ACXVQ0_00290 [Actinomycetota bacterium]